MRRCSVVLVTRNGIGSLFHRCLVSLRKAKWIDPEFIVVDNGSTDDSATVADSLLRPHKLLSLGRNEGVSRAFNTGAFLASTPALIFVTQDAIPRPDCLLNIVEALENHDDSIGIVGCKLLYPSSRAIQHAGAYLEHPRATPVHIGHLEADEGQHDRPAAVEYVTGAIFGVKRRVWEEVGGFDERFIPAYYEDADFCLRVREAGQIVWYEPSAVAIHGENSVTKSLPRARLWLLNVNRLRYIFKHFEPEMLVEEFAAAEIQAFLQTHSHIERLSLSRAYRWNYKNDAPFDPDRVKAIDVTMSRIRRYLKRADSEVS